MQGYAVINIEKRDGRIQEFRLDKIRGAITSALIETDEVLDSDTLEQMVKIIAHHVVKNRELRHVEKIQDLVEYELMQVAPKTAKRYILYREERRKERDKPWEFTDIQRDIWENKYRKDESESFDKWIDRVSAGNESLAKAIRNKDFLFGGRILANRGLQNEGRKITYSNCYVMPSPEDNIESIFDTAKLIARTYSYGGGCGFSLENLRPRNAGVNNASLSTTGAVSFMPLFDVTTGTIGQQGRRGALMLDLPIDHPDAEEFIDVKLKEDVVTKANISVRITDEFMENYREREDYRKDFLVKDTGETFPYKVKPLKLMQQISKNNWNMAEPGMLFWDKIDKYHLLEHHSEFKLTSVNPCGELPLPDFGACLLGSINLSNFVVNPYTKEAQFDFDRFNYIVDVAVRALNDVIDEGMELHPLPEQREHAFNYRPIGLGVMGYADTMIKMGVEYGKDNTGITEKIMDNLLNTAMQSSAMLAKEHGSFPKYETNTTTSKFFISNANEITKQLVNTFGLRNSHLISIAPTGSISTLIDVSGGLEPLFAKSYNRTTKSLHEGDVTYKVYPKVIKELMDKMEVSEEELPKYVTTSHEINWKDRVKLQGTFQKYVDSSISSTVNLPEETTENEIQELYYSAWAYGLKGITIYRDNCFRTGILTVDKEEEDLGTCPECKGSIIRTEGCLKCGDCGWGQCSI